MKKTLIIILILSLVLIYSCKEDYRESQKIVKKIDDLKFWNQYYDLGDRLELYKLKYKNGHILICRYKDSILGYTGDIAMLYIEDKEVNNE